MATFTTRSNAVARLAACFLTFAAAPVFAQTRAVAPMEGFSAHVAPVSPIVVQAGVVGLNTAFSPISVAAAASGAAPSRIATPRMAAPAAMPAVAAAAPRAASASAGRGAEFPAAAASVESVGSRARQSHPNGAREAVAIATVNDGIADWTSRSAETLDAAATHAAASEGAGPLSRPSASVTAERPALETPAPEVPASSGFKRFFSWSGPILALTALVLAVDAGTKYYAVHHLFHLFHEVAWRKPLILGLIPFITFTAYKLRSGLPHDRSVKGWSITKIFNGRFGFYATEYSGLNTMIKEHPSLRWAVRIYDVSIALMLGGMLGNGLDTLRIGGAMDWIPLGRSLMNFADVAVILGLSYFQASSTFFLTAAAAHKAGKPTYFSYAWFLGLPLAGVFAAWAFGSAAGGGALDLAMKNVGYLYLMAFSMLLGFGRFIAVAIVNVFAKRFVAEEGARLAAPATKN